MKNLVFSWKTSFRSLIQRFLGKKKREKIKIGFCGHLYARALFINSLLLINFGVCLGVWRLPIIAFCVYSAAKPLDKKRRDMIIMKDAAVAQMVQRHPEEFRDILERKKTYARHFTDYSQILYM